MNKRKVLGGLAFIVLILLFVTLGGLIYSCRTDDASQESGGMILDDSAKPYDPAEAMATDSSGIAIPGYSTVYFPENETSVQMTLYNPEQNTCLFKFELYIDEESEPIASTDLIEAGKAVENITLSRPLAAGEYDLYIKVLPYTTDTYTALNNALVRAELCVLADE